MSAVPNTVPTFGEIAGRLAENGYRPVPIIVGQKRPPMEAWQRFIFDDASALRYSRNYTGILCGEVCAVDIDILDPDACAAVRDLALQILGPAPERIGFPPKRLFAYRIDTPMKKLQIVGEAGKVEILGDGQQFVAYAIHPDTGRPYEWVGYDNPLDTPLERLPTVTESQIRAFLSRAALLMGVQADSGIQSSGFADGQEADERWGRAIAQVLAGGDLHDSIRNLAAGWIASGMPGAAAVQALRALMENSAARKLRPRDWQARYEDIPRQVRTAQEKYEQPAAPEVIPTSIDFGQLEHEEIPEHKFLVPDWLPCGHVSLLAGHGGSGKSFAALVIQVLLAAGYPVLGHEVPRMKVMLISAEDGMAVIKKRIQRICRYFGISPSCLAGYLHICDWSDVPNPVIFAEKVANVAATTAMYERLRQEVAQFDPDLLVLDNSSLLFAGNENSRPMVQQFVNSLRRLVRLDAGVLLLHHVDKASVNDSKAEGYSGSTGWHNACRARWFMVEKDDERSLELRKTNYGKKGATASFVWDHDARLLRPDGEVQTKREREQAKQEANLRWLVQIMVEHLKKKDAFLSTSQYASSKNAGVELGRLMNLKPGEVRKLLEVASSRGLVETFTEERGLNKTPTDGWKVTGKGVAYAGGGH